MSNVILVNPPLFEDYTYKAEHLGLMYLASSLRQSGHSVQIIDAQMSRRNLTDVAIEIAESGHTDLVGFAVQTKEGLFISSTIASYLRLIGMSCHITIGGYYASFWTDKILSRFPQFDSVVIGEGELTLLELLDCINGKMSQRNIPGFALRDNGSVRINETRRLEKNLDTFPFPARDCLTDCLELGYPTSISSSRGCVNRCSFCMIQMMYSKQPGPSYRQQSAARTIEEIRQLVRSHGINFVFFVDDDFIGPGSKCAERALEIARGLAAMGTRFAIHSRPQGIDRYLFKQLKEMGLEFVIVGIESALDRVLIDFNKGMSIGETLEKIHILRDLDIELVPTFIFWEPHMNTGDVKDLIRFIREEEYASPLQLHSLIIPRNSTYHEILARQGRVFETQFSLDYSIADPQVELLRQLVEPGYQDVYGRTFNGIYLMHFLYPLIDNPAERGKMRSAVKKIMSEARATHADFLEGVLNMIQRGDLSDYTKMLERERVRFDELSKTIEELNDRIVRSSELERAARLCSQAEKLNGNFRGARDA